MDTLIDSSDRLGGDDQIKGKHLYCFLVLTIDLTLFIVVDI